jgi:hypothetical protein
LVKWDQICTPYPEGGLAIRHLRRFNEALLGKWLWRFEEAFWRQVVIEKYGSLGGGWMSKMPSGLYGIGLWKFIRDGWDKFSRFLKFEVGDGSQIRFWDDVWCLDESLKAAFMELYRITCVRDAAVANIIRIRSESVHWEVNFTRLV